MAKHFEFSHHASQSLGFLQLTSKTETSGQGWGLSLLDSGICRSGRS